MDSIEYIDKPAIVNIQDWMASHRGFVGLGTKMSDRRKTSIFAMQKADCASQQIKELAKKRDAIILVSVSDGDVNAID